MHSGSTSVNIRTQSELNTLHCHLEAIPCHCQTALSLVNRIIFNFNCRGCGVRVPSTAPSSGVWNFLSDGSQRRPYDGVQCNNIQKRTKSCLMSQFQFLSRVDVFKRIYNSCKLKVPHLPKIPPSLTRCRPSRSHGVCVEVMTNASLTRNRTLNLGIGEKLNSPITHTARGRARQALMKPLPLQTSKNQRQLTA